MGTHKLQLRKQSHHNPHLQNAWNKYGENNFYVMVTESVNPQNLFEVEQKYLDLVKSEKTFHIIHHLQRLVQ